MEEKMITITQDEYDQLIRKNRFLECLERCGVDNWDGWEYAWEMFEETGEED